MKVSIHELKNHLSQYLSLLQEEGIIIITSHRKLIAKILPIPQVLDETNNLIQIEGVSWNGKKPSGGKNRPKITGKTVAEYVIEERR